MDTVWSFRMLLALPLLSTFLMYVGSYYLSRVTGEGTFTPSPKTLFSYFFLKKNKDFEAIHLSNFIKFKSFILLAQVVNVIAFITFCYFLSTLSI